MEFSRFNLARGGSLLAISLAVICGLGLRAEGQQVPAASPVEVPALPPAQPLSEAAQTTVPNHGQAVKNSANATATDSGTAAVENSPLLRLSAGDLLEVSIYNVPELSTKARVGSTGDVYLPLIDYVHVSDLTVEEAQSLIQKRLENGGFVRDAHVTVFLDES